MKKMKMIIKKMDKEDESKAGKKYNMSEKHKKAESKGMKKAMKKKGR